MLRYNANIGYSDALVHIVFIRLHLLFWYQGIRFKHSKVNFKP